MYIKIKVNAHGTVCKKKDLMTNKSATIFLAIQPLTTLPFIMLYLMVNAGHKSQFPPMNDAFQLSFRSLFL
ncbi:hypothetical protein BIY29_00760 [Brenneria alni]|uniref:Uncharacterized protein n=1 Tax=Brenneria alni TaxID=71656 RepID=A0A421DU20_9GAMM|nr:hypothetical protein BIY29_00760 [Brenneria alni]